jgi:hypothetical protein
MLKFHIINLDTKFRILERFIFLRGEDCHPDTVNEFNRNFRYCDCLKSHPEIDFKHKATADWLTNIYSISFDEFYMLYESNIATYRQFRNSHRRTVRITKDMTLFLLIMLESYKNKNIIKTISLHNDIDIYNIIAKNSIYKINETLERLKMHVFNYYTDYYHLQPYLSPFGLNPYHNSYKNTYNILFSLYNNGKLHILQSICYILHHDIDYLTVGSYMAILDFRQEYKIQPEQYWKLFTQPRFCDLKYLIPKEIKTFVHTTIKCGLDRRLFTDILQINDYTTRLTALDEFRLADNDAFINAMGSGGYDIINDYIRLMPYIKHHNIKIENEVGVLQRIFWMAKELCS